MKKLVLTTALATFTGPALAHTGVGLHTHGLAAGFTHPFLGADHLLAMLAVGLWGAAALPHRLWLAPASFVGGMIAGAGLQLAGMTLPHVEGMIALSVLAFGLMTAFALRVPAVAALALTALFALSHGYAHAAEASGTFSAYLAGFVAATALIHAAGVGVGLGVLRFRYALPVLGAGIAAAGIAMLAG